jgi:hypothetical protein
VNQGTKSLPLIKGRLYRDDAVTKKKNLQQPASPEMNSLGAAMPAY